MNILRADLLRKLF